MNRFMESNNAEIKKENDNPNKALTLSIFILLALSIIVYITTYLRFYEIILFLPPNYSVSLIIGLLPIIFSLINLISYIVMIRAADKEKELNQSDDKALKKSNNKTNESKNKTIKIILWVINSITILTLIASQVFLIVIVAVVI